MFFDWNCFRATSALKMTVAGPLVLSDQRSWRNIANRIIRFIFVDVGISVCQVQGFPFNAEHMKMVVRPKHVADNFFH
jgi:hypothetical protein